MFQGASEFRSILHANQNVHINALDHLSVPIWKFPMIFTLKKPYFAVGTMKIQFFFMHEIYATTGVKLGSFWKTKFFNRGVYKMDILK